MKLIPDLEQMITPETLAILVDLNRKMEASLAGAALRARPRKRDRVFTGRIGRRRVHRGRLIRLPDGRIGHVQRALRGLVLVWIPDLEAVAGHQELVVRAGECQLLPDPAAVSLGRLRRGTVERPSARKRKSARRNGQMPCRPGRRRGRPRGRSSSDSELVKGPRTRS